MQRYHSVSTARVLFSLARFFLKQKEDPDVLWKLPDNFEVVYSQVQGEVVVGGVFLRIFISQPTWVSILVSYT